MSKVNKEVLKICENIAANAWQETLDNGVKALTVNCPANLAKHVADIIFNDTSYEAVHTFEEFETFTTNQLLVSPESMIDAGDYAKTQGGSGDDMCGKWVVKFN